MIWSEKNSGNYSSLISGTVLNSWWLVALIFCTSERWQGECGENEHFRIDEI